MILMISMSQPVKQRVTLSCSPNDTPKTAGEESVSQSDAVNDLKAIPDEHIATHAHALSSQEISDAPPFRYEKVCNVTSQHSAVVSVDS